MVIKYTEFHFSGCPINALTHETEQSPVRVAAIYSTYAGNAHGSTVILIVLARIYAH